MNPQLINTLISAIVSTGAGAVVGNAVKLTTPVAVTPLNKALITVGSVTLSSLVGGQAAKHAVAQVNQTVNQLKALKDLRSAK